jgi:hypothetical protein
MNYKPKSDLMKQVRYTAHLVLGIKIKEIKYSYLYFKEMREMIKDIDVFAFTPIQIHNMKIIETMFEESKIEFFKQDCFFIYAMAKLFIGFLHCFK